MAQFGSAVNSGHFDANQVPSITAVQGTLGTADVSGTATTLPISNDPSTGAMYTMMIGTSPTGTSQVTILGGTIQAGTFNNSGTNVNIVTGTINVGTFNNTGTFVNISTGSLVGTVTSNMNSGTLNVGTVVIPSGTINVGTFTNTGTVVNIATGSLVGTLLGGTLTNLATGTLNALAAGTITTGTVSVTIGTITGKDANAVAITANPIAVGGTDSGGTVRNMLVDTTGVQRSTGSQVMTVGTLTTGTLQNLVTGTLNALASGTITTGTVSVTIGTVGGGAANAAAASGNPNPVGGTDSGGTIRTILVDATGVQRSTGTQVMSVGTLTTGTLQNLVTGTINALASGTITGGTLQNLNAGTVTVVSSLTNGSVNILTGTQQLLGTLQLGTVQQLLPPNISQTVYGTFGTTGALVFGTLAGGTSSGAGTEIFVTGCSIVIPANSGSQDISIGFGTNAGALHNGTGVLARGFFVAGGGISRTFIPAINSGTNAQVTLCIGGAGTVEANISYFTTPSTL